MKDYIAKDRHGTGNSYLSAQWDVTNINFPTLEDAVKYVTQTLIGFYSEQTGNHYRWKYINKSDLNAIWHDQTLDYETNLEIMGEFIERDGSFDCSGGLAPKYDIVIRKNKGTFEVNVTTFVHMLVQSDMFSWFSEEAMKAALQKKINYLKNSTL